MKLLFTIKSKLFLSFLVFLFATLTLAGMLFWYDSQMQQVENLTTMLWHVDLDIRQSDKLEKDFFTSEALSLQFYESGDSRYVLQHRELTHKLRQDLLSLRAHPLIPSSALRTQIDTLREKLIDYENTFDELVNRVYQRGFKNQGYEGKMSEHLDFFERQTPLSPVLIQKIRNAEQRFLLYKEEPLVLQVNLLLNQLKEEILSTAPSAITRTEWIETLEKYAVLWNKLTTAERKIGFRSHTGLKGKLTILSYQIEKSIEDIGQKVREEEQKFRLASRQKLIFVVIASILLNLVLGGWMMRKLGTPIKQISEAIHDVIEQDFSGDWQPIPIRHKDEIGRLSKDVNLLVSRILERTAEVYRQNEELHAQKTELEQQTEEILAQRDLLELQNQSIYEQNYELEEQKEQIQIQNKRITASINYACRIQQAMLPSQNMLQTLVPKSFIFFRPRDIVSGDFYFFAQKEDKLVIAAVDCTGHGVPGAFMSVIGNDLLTQIVVWRGITQSNQILDELHKGIVQTLKQEETENRDGMDISLCVVDKTANTIQFSGAKNSLFSIDKEGNTAQIKGDATHVGGVAKQKDRSFTVHELKPQAGTRFYLLSDGYIDQFGGDHGRKFSTKRFHILMQKLHHVPIQTQEKVIEKHFLEWKKDEKQIDDVLVMGFEI